MSAAERIRTTLPAHQDARATLPGLSDPESPAYERDEVYRQRTDFWNMLDDLRNGTGVMRLATTKWLPQEPKELTTPYNNRLNRSFLFNGYRDALSKLTSKPFSKPVVIENIESLPEQLHALADDVDMQGNNITTFASKAFEEAMHRGAVHFYVDYPSLAEDASLADVEAIKARPYIRTISVRDILGWKTETRPNGKAELTEVRFLERHEITDGAFGATSQYQIRIVSRDKYEVYVLNEDGDGWEQDVEKSGTHTFGSIPIVTCYFNQTGLMTAEPVFMDLGWLNLAHWQSSSDQRNILRFARTGLYYAKGFTDKEAQGIVIGPNQVVSSSSENSDFKVVEYSGSSIEQGRLDLDDLQEQMEMLGLRPLLERSGNITATATASDDNNSQNQVQHWIRLLENALVQALSLANRWAMGTPDAQLNEDTTIDIFNDFGVSIRAAQDIDSLIKAREKREISRETFLRELKRRGLLNDTVDVEEEIGRLEAEGPDLGEMSTGLLGEGDEDEAEQGPNNRGALENEDA